MMRKAFTIGVLVFALSACDSQPPVPQANAPAVAPAVIQQRYRDGGAAALAALRSEPKIVDIHFDPAAAVEWNIGVHTDGSRRYGFAEYVCLVLDAKHARDERTDVRIVDIDRVAAGDDFRTASLGTVRCSDTMRLD